MNVTNKWPIVKLLTLAVDIKGAIAGGPFGSDLVSRDYVASGVPVIRGSNLPKNAKFSFEDLVFVTENKADAHHLNCAHPGDLVFTQRGTLGQIGLLPKNSPYSRFLISQSQMKMTVDANRADSLYLYNYFRLPSTVAYIENHALQSGVPHINLGILKKLQVICPPLAVQKKIVATISAYDDLIENNQRRIALLEKMAEEIYREWFVRLRFPGHENVKNVKGIPEGWEIDRVDSIGKIVTGKTPSTDNPRYFGGPYTFVKTPDMHGNIFIVETEERLSQNGLDSQPSQTIPRGSICVSCIGTGGIVSITTSECQTNQQINSVVVRNLSDLEWAFFTLRNLREAIQMFGATGATMTNLSKGKFSSLKILRPNKSIVLKYHALVNPIFVQMENILQQTMILRSTRDLLLPRLISGKLSVEHLDIQFPPGMEESAHVN
ncbi:restriction endonuclease subunit S [Nitrosomonas sp.]|uniref:restriction endonuclease subunit S n=1 Tax=Nitrosomonas sp. TaxID=42353 RepID=UPI0025D4A6A2|nr:restriction endonuclease subunit S [Nitrosomonas sp.]